MYDYPFTSDHFVNDCRSAQYRWLAFQDFRDNIPDLMECISEGTTEGMPHVLLDEPDVEPAPKHATVIGDGYLWIIWRNMRGGFDMVDAREYVSPSTFDALQAYRPTIQAYLATR